VKSERTRKMAILVVVILVQSLTFIVACGIDCFSEYGYIRRSLSGGFSGILILFGMCLSVVGVALILKIFWDMESQMLTEVESTELHKSREMINSLRAQRHDFGNHLQVICGLIQLNNNRKALDYINKIMQDVKTSGNLSVVDDSPIINALLLTKFTQAQNSGIKFSVDLQADLNRMELPQYKVGKVLANIINNALEAVSELQEDERRIEVKVYQTATHIVFRIWNNGSFIQPSYMQKIFEPGYTTKGEKGQGLGLYIVKALLQEMNGEVHVESCLHAGTVFVISLPLRREVTETALHEDSIAKQIVLEETSIAALGRCD
jgi:two-component system sensor histidine kinase AgrC